MNGISVSFVPDTIIGTVVMASVILSWLFLTGKVIGLG
jgi:hypothetical protein